MRKFLIGGALAAAFSAMPALAQNKSATSPEHMDHGHMGHQNMDHGPAPAPASQDHASQDHAAHDHAASMKGEGSGTARLPVASSDMGGAMAMSGKWMLMAHGYVWGVYTDHGGPRGDDKLYAQTMAMLSAEGPIGGSGVRLMGRAMLSAEPLMSRRGYPNLFATGETAFGIPLVDRQHPHDLFMELAAKLSIETGGGGTAFLYGGPVAEPALGPSAFMHRGSARYNPEAPITHHWFDSTHITYGVVTAGYATPRFQLEASAFRGREPDERRWNIETPKLDSWSTRVSWSPSDRWLAQLSYGRLKEPEALHPGENEGRLTASVQYGTPRLELLAAFSAKDRRPGTSLTAWLLEGNWNPQGGHNLFGRVENVANDELFPHGHPLHDRKFRLTKVQAGYAYRIPLAGPLNLALGGSANAYGKSSALDAAYGRKPFGYSLFARLSLGH